MATPVPIDKVKDKEYSNWLKVTLALYYMKSGLHTFMQSEIDYLHQSLVQKIYGGRTVLLPPCTICHACHVKRNKYSGVWTLSKQCKSYCDVWLDELLVLHSNPKSERIYWDNSDVASWPFKSWECAKVFMPRGQLPSSVGPAECDAQAILTLLNNCTHFHHKLSSQSLGLTRTISTIRNNIIHNGEMKLSDADRRAYTQQIIQFLEDPVSLKSLDDCKAAVGNIQKIDNDSLDVFFNLDIEMSGLRSAVSELRLELGMQNKITLDTVDFLKDEYKQLREQITKRVADVENRMDSIERNTQSVKDQTDMTLQQQEKKHQEMQAAIANLSGNVTSQEVRFVAFEENVQYVGSKLQEIKTNTDTALQQQEKKHQEMHTTVTNLSADVTSHGVRLVAFEENLQSFGTELQELKTDILTQKGNNSGRKRGKARKRISDNPVRKREESDGLRQPKQTPVKKRQESDGLRRLKSQTEDKLDTARRLEIIPTTQAEEAKNILDGKRSVVIKGNPGEGKTTAALHLIDNEMYRNRRVVVYCPNDWKVLDTDWVDIAMLEDIFGQFDLDPGCLQEWLVYLPTIQEHVDAGKLRVIITTRVDILSKAYSKLGSVKLFSDNLSMTLSSDELKNSEKMSILNKELQRHKRNMNENEKEKCISNFSGLIGFPQCCSLFVGDINLFDGGPEFFKSPAKLFVDNITKLEDTRFLSLAFLFCNGKISEEYLSPETMPEPSKHLLMELTFSLGISKKKASITLLRENYDIFSGLYVVKTVSNKRTYIWFSHATVCEAVGQVIGDRCIEIVVKYSESAYLYQRTYTAESKDRTSQNVFIPVSVFGILAERMVNDVADKRLLESVVKHSAIKHHQFLMKLKDELDRGNRVKNFFGYRYRINFPDVSKGECVTFMQHLLQSDGDVVTFLKFLECMHGNKISDCWQCQEKQNLLELALYYHQFQIADKLIAMNACYTHISLCNAARHGDLRRVQTIIKTLKKGQVFGAVCEKAKEALCRAYISGNQDVIELFLKEGITLDTRHVVDVVRHGDMNALLKVIEHLKCHNNWTPHMEKYWIKKNAFLHPSVYPGKIIFSNALYIAYCNEKFDMADQLVQNGVIVSMDMLLGVLLYSSQEAVSRLIQALKDTSTWDSNWCLASVALQIAYSKQKYDACDLLIKLGFSLTMKNLPGVINRSEASFESVKKAIQHLKDNSSFDPNCRYASEALKYAYGKQKYDVCDLLVRDGVSLTMKNLPFYFTHQYNASFEMVKKAIQHLKGTRNWNPECDDASKALEKAYTRKQYDVCDLLVKDGVSLTMKNLPDIIISYEASLESVTKATQHLKDTDKWDPKCDDAFKALKYAYYKEAYDVFDLLAEEGIPQTMIHFPDLIGISKAFESVKKTMQDLKDTYKWDPKWKYATEALKEAYRLQKYDVCDLLIQEGVSLTLRNLSSMLWRSKLSVESVKKAIQLLKDSGSWDPKCHEACKALRGAYKYQNYEVCDLLVKEGVTLTMKNLCEVVCFSYFGSFETVKKDINKWNDVSVKKAIQHLKDTDNWDPKCNDASEALKSAYSYKMYDVCNLLYQEGVTLSMKIFFAICNSETFEFVKKAIQHLKDTDNWDPKFGDASRALEHAYRAQKDDLCNLLVQEGVSLTMKNIPHLSMYPSFVSVKKGIQHLKDTDSWDPKCVDASIALGEACWRQNYDVFDLLVQEGVTLTMENLYSAKYRVRGSFESVKKAIKQLKDTNNWDPKCDDAIDLLTDAYRKQEYDVCELLVQEGVSITMKNLLSVVSFGTYSVDSEIKRCVRKMIQDLRNTNKWDPGCDDASKALEDACSRHWYDMFKVLVKEGVSLTMKNLPGIICKAKKSVRSVRKAIQHLKGSAKWEPNCVDAGKALENAYSQQKYDVCDLLLQEGVSLTMRNLSGFICEAKTSIETVKKVIQKLKDTGNWDPNCVDACKALENAYSQQNNDFCDLLLQEGVSLTK